MRRAARGVGGVALGLILGCGCAEDPAPQASAGPAVEASPEPVDAPTPNTRARAPTDLGEATHLRVPSADIHRARREAAGLRRMPPGLRAQTLSRRRAEGGPSYAALRADADAHALSGISVEGRVGLVRPAGEGLWIMAVHTRRNAGTWTDPLYVLSAVDPALSEGAIARVDGWVVGAREIGRHTLPLVLAYHVEPVPTP